MRPQVLKAGTLTLAQASRNRDRMKNIIIFFVAYAAFKQCVDKDMF